MFCPNSFIIKIGVTDLVSALAGIALGDWSHTERTIPIKFEVTMEK